MRPTTSPHPLGSPAYSPLHPLGSNNSLVGGGIMPPSPTIGSSATTTATTSATQFPHPGESLVRSARKEWNRHGKALTQDMEETRRRDENRPGTLTVRLISAENRRDVTGRKYTAYVLKVRLPDGKVLQLEHRYSEFVKLKDAMDNHGVVMDAVFPSKHLAGRIGNWQLARRWAPDQHDELVRYRTVQLDVWLVGVTARYNLGDVPHSLARTIYDFLTLSDRPPCDLENTLAVATLPSSLREERSFLGGSKSGGGSSSSALRWNNPIPFTLGSSIRQACRIVEELCMPSSSSSSSSKMLLKSDQSIPLDLLQCARGLIFLTVLKAGFMVSGRIGTGLLIAKTEGNGNGNGGERWSAPCALGTIGMGWGMLAGGDITHYLVVLTTQNAVETMLSGTVQLGTEFGVAIGPVGRMMEVSASASNTRWTVHPAYSYAHSKGFFVGMSIEGAVLSTRNDVNAKFYGRSDLTGADLVLDGNMPQPRAAEPLYRALDRALATEIPHDGFRPSQLFHESSNSRNANGNANGNGNGNGNADDPLFAAWNDYDYDHGTDDAVFAAGAAASGEMPGSLFSYYGRRQRQRQQQNATRQQQQQHYQQTTIPDL